MHLSYVFLALSAFVASGWFIWPKVVSKPPETHMQETYVALRKWFLAMAFVLLLSAGIIAIS